MIDTQSCGSLAACIVECIQSSGGINILPEGYTKALKKRCEARGMLLIVDEAQTGVGGAGSFMTFQQHDIVPYILTLSETLGSGLPLRAVVTSSEINSVCAARDYSFAMTHVNDPLPAAVGDTVLDIVFRGNLPNKGRRLGGVLHLGLQKLQQRYGCIGDVGATGLMAGLEIASDEQTKAPALYLADRTEKRAYKIGVWFNLCSHRSFDGTLRVLPPIKVTEEQMKEGLKML